MFAARFRGRNTMMSPLPEASCSAPSSLARADVAASCTQRSVSRNVADVDVSAPGDGREVARNVKNLNMAAFRLNFCGGAAPRCVVQSRNADASCLDVSALGV